MPVLNQNQPDYIPEELPPDAQTERQYKDALSFGLARGRGAGLNPGNRFESLRLHVLGEHLDETVGSRLAGQAPGSARPCAQQVATTVLDDRSESILNYVDSPDLGFQWTLNPYRGCEHGCTYCFARPTHEYLGLSSGLDFETKLFAKPRAPELLRKALCKPSWKPQPIVMAGVTDVYQPIEAEYEITRRCLEVCLEFRQPVAVITKNKLILRDLDLLRQLAAEGLVHAALSITTLDPKLSASMEPRASSPRARLDAVRELAKAGVPVGVMTAPIIPGLNDEEIPALLRASAGAGARWAGYVLLRLPHQNKDLFLEWLRRTFPQRAAKIESLIRQTRAGDLYDARWNVRGRGEGPLAENIRRTHEIFRRRYRLDARLPVLVTSKFRVPPFAALGTTVRLPERSQRPHQPGLFGGAGF